MWAFAGVGVAYCRSLDASVFACFAYIHMPCIRAHVKCSSWEGLRVAERRSGEHWVGWHGTFEPSSSFGGECERDIVLGRCGWEGFLGIEYSLDRETVALSLSRRLKVCAMPISSSLLLSRPSLGKLTPSAP